METKASYIVFSPVCVVNMMGVGEERLGRGFGRSLRSSDRQGIFN